MAGAPDMVIDLTVVEAVSRAIKVPSGQILISN
jgi:hypothetical protein